MNHAFKSLVVAALVAGCSAPPPPAFISIDGEFSEAEHVTIRDAVSAWCDAVGWCPQEAAWSDRGHLALVDFIEPPKQCPKGSRCEVEAHNDGDNIAVLRSGVARVNMDRMWLAVAHEFGHFCTGHTKTGLMSPVHNAGEPLVVDAVAAAAWQDGCP